MDYDNKNIVLNELIGLKVLVISCLDKKQKGIRGIVIDETKNTIIIKSGKDKKSLIKKNSMFRFYYGKQHFDVEGKEINFRPDERIEKGLKYYRKRKE
ncbi:MAG: ribonuclease P protein component 1 [Candidatus Micrarchaeia archaeon]